MSGPPYSIIEYFYGGGLQKVVSDTKNSQKYTYKFLGNLQNKENRRGVKGSVSVWRDVNTLRARPLLCISS
jgi:hypothetical protein